MQALKYKHPDVRGFAVGALRRIGPEAVPALIKALEAEQPNVRRDAARLLGRIGTQNSGP